MFQVKTYIRFSDFQSKSELLMTEKVLPFTDEVIAVLLHKCSQQLQLLALHLEMLGYIPGLSKGFGYLRKTGDLIGDMAEWVRSLYFSALNHSISSSLCLV